MVRKLTDDEKSALARVAELPDEDIDLTDPDAPEIVDWTGAERGKFYRPVKKQTTIRIDADVLEWFKRHPRGRGYQTHINAALREYVDRKQREGV
jgi:uncharacterized protein (DUF4415 family)